MNIIDSFLNNITMYRLVLYFLIWLLAAAFVLSFMGKLPFSPFFLIFSTIFILVISLITNYIFAKVFEAPANSESVYITALILALIITPAKSGQDSTFLFWAAVISMASKYILAISKKHIFNPAAFSVALTALTLNQSASWWVGTSSMIPFTALGVLIVRKLRRFDLIFFFFVTTLTASLGLNLLSGHNPFITLQKALFDSPLLFFAFVMLTEPLTMPPTKLKQSIYGGLVGFLFAPQVHFGSIFTTPETALLAGNILSYFVSFKKKLVLALKDRYRIAPDIYNFVFDTPGRLNFLPGQYMEWTLNSASPDSRGNRRYFTLASSPTEEEVKIGVKFYERASSFKKDLLSMGPGEKIIASQLAGDFVLPKDPNIKLVMIAGGIGITPFRSMIKYLLDTNEHRQITLFYSNKTASEIVYEDIFDTAAGKIGLKTVYVLTDQAPSYWQGRVGRIDEQVIIEEVPDFQDCMYFLSGPHAMVTYFEKVLANLGIKDYQIKTDYFPGFA